MFRNYLVTALRNFLGHKLYSFINVAGLAVGLACAIFIILFIRDELSYDRWIPGSENLYRIETSLHFPGERPFVDTASPDGLGPTMKDEIPQVAVQTRLTRQNSTVTSANRQFFERIDFVDSNFFQVVELPLIEGNAADVFLHPESAVLSQTAAHKYFGDANPMGKAFTVDGAHSLTVTGVMRDLPHNTQLSGDVFVPITSSASRLGKTLATDWFDTEVFTYIGLSPGADPARVQAMLPALFERHVPPQYVAAMHLKASDVISASILPFREIHLTSDARGEMTPGGSWATVYGFAVIAVLILAIACFNFTNLATARAMMRAREFSLRKVMGARRGQLIVQFLGESVLTALIALGFALAIAEILLPAFDRLLNQPIAFSYLADWPLTLGIVAIAILSGLLAGFYSALVLSGFRPAATLKTNASGQGGSGLLRATLVVLQFAISIGLGIAALVVFAQIRYARELDLGFNHDNIVVVGSYGQKAMNQSTAESFMHALDSNSDIVGVAQSEFVPFEASDSRSGVILPGHSQQLIVRAIAVSPELPVVYGMKLISGRLLSRAHGTDTQAAAGAEQNVVIDATAARRFGFAPQDAVGRTFRFGGHSPLKIVGVVHDTLFRAAQEAAIGTVYIVDPENFVEFSVRVKSGRVPEALAAIDRTWHRFAPNTPVQRHFLDDSFDKLFAADEQKDMMFGLFVGIAIFIACLGLFGLAAFTAERRTREIGIRKAFGARTRDIAGLLLWQFSIPVLIANVIAWPVAWYYLHHWLETYAYRISLSPLYFIGAGAAALLIAWLTVSAHALRVARATPVHALRYE